MVVERNTTGPRSDIEFVHSLNNFAASNNVFFLYQEMGSLLKGAYIKQDDGLSFAGPFH